MLQPSPPMCTSINSGVHIWKVEYLPDITREITQSSNSWNGVNSVTCMFGRKDPLLTIQ